MNIPGNYEEWRYCITVGCGLNLYRHFIEQRITIMEDDHSDYVKTFVQCYGEAYYRQVLKWFYRAKQQAI
ncbi:hypothetical protein [Mucilaginibacter straminoryzae]|uniref:hypothetical protein n=1 Tax=Mucilaginibacter straminoryzae TaxID=2932774 RepID=UPI001FD6A2DA|nr:hypothetical protein [Mucilaginibacter straminoryzae]